MGTKRTGALPLAQDVMHIYHRIFDQFRIVDSERVSRSDDFEGTAQWLETPGCLFQRNNLVLGSRIRTEGVIKAGLFVTIVLKGAGNGGPRKGTTRFRYSENTIVVMALRKPAPCGGEAPRGAHMLAAGLAFPRPSIERLGLEREFLDLFSASQGDEFVTTLKAPPRILAMANEMLIPTLRGRAEELLLSAHATEILARVVSLARDRASMDLSSDHRQRRLLGVRDAIDADPRRQWKIAQLAREAGISRRSFNTHFRRTFGITASEYLRTRRLELARDAIIQQGVSVNEASYLAGYGNPANFATAFRRHFGHAPSRYRPLDN
jgi:AraC-like DNA-binding protein